MNLLLYIISILTNVVVGVEDDDNTDGRQRQTVTEKEMVTLKK